MINKIFFKLPFVTSPAKEAPEEATEKPIALCIPENNIEDNNDEYGFYTKKTSKVKNALVGSLMGLATIGLPTLTIIDAADRKSFYNYNRHAEPIEEVITCNPEKLAQGCGDDDSLVELDEIMNLIDFSGMAQLPEGTKKAILTVASAHVQPVYANDPDAKEKIIKQTQEIQQMVDKLIYKEVVNPDPTVEERLAEYRRNNITADDLFEFIDFSELQKYQKDISVLKAGLRNTIGYIPRKDFDSNERAEQAVENAQKFVDELTAKYKRYSKIAGNSDYDHILSKEELIGLLDQRSADGIDKKTKARILANATAGYKTIMFRDINDAQIKETNEKVCEEIQKAQDKFDNQANNYRLEQFKAKYGID